MLEQLFGIQYTGSVDGNVYGYYVSHRPDGMRIATVHAIRPTGNVHLGVVEIPEHNHAVTVKAAVPSFLYV